MFQPGPLRSVLFLLTVCLLVSLVATHVTAEPRMLKRAVIDKSISLSTLTDLDAGQIVVKFREETGPLDMNGRRFQRTGDDWSRLNQIIVSDGISDIKPGFTIDKVTLAKMREEGSRRLGQSLPDLSLYYELSLAPGLSSQRKRDILRQIIELEIVETAYFAPVPDLATAVTSVATPAFQGQQYHLLPAPTGINAYYGWGFAGGRGENVKVIDIEGNWLETHEDLHGGTDTWHIAGDRLDDPSWWNHGTAVLGEIASDSNEFGMTGIAYNVALGTVSIGSMSVASAIMTASAHASAGDIILIELHAPGPHYDFKSRPDQRGYVAMEYWQAEFDAILTASALGQIVVEAGGNGNENYDDVSIYDSLFYPQYRFSGAIMVAASCADHTPASFTNYGLRLDVHAFGCWDVYTLGYGDLYGTTINDSYTDGFSGTSSASPIIVGACAVLQGIHKNLRGLTLDHNGLRDLLTAHSTPQLAHYKRIGPMPDLFGSCNALTGSCCVRRGDVDHNGAIDILDLEYLTDWLYRAGSEPNCLEESDADANDQTDVLDLEFLVNYLWLSGPGPATCQ